MAETLLLVAGGSAVLAIAAGTIFYAFSRQGLKPSSHLPIRRAFDTIVFTLVASFLLAGVGFAIQGSGVHIRPLETVLPATWSGELSLYVDPVAGVMMTLVGFIGVCVLKYSRRYLAGDSRQAALMSAMTVSIAAVELMIMSGSLIMFVGAWLIASLGLHLQLSYYRDRPRARSGARLKFLTARLGDIALCAAVLFVSLGFGTTNFPDWFSAASGELSERQSASLGIAAWLIVIGAAIKSAQVPFHVWLPRTLDTPTPVSALMHAGMVNAGGYLLIRVSPIFSATPQAGLALSFLAIVGTVTAVIGGLSMMTASSIKRQLAYSTISQMGFMMIQCGLGIFGGALLHLILHSLYKAYSFLASGTLTDSRKSPASQLDWHHRSNNLWRSSTILLPAVGIVIAAIVYQLPAEHRGAIAAIGAMVFALTSMIRRDVEGVGVRWSIAGLLPLLLGVYAIGYWGCHTLYNATATTDGFIAAVGPCWFVVSGFTLLAVIQSMIATAPRHPTILWLYRMSLENFGLDRLWFSGPEGCRNSMTAGL